MDILKQKIVLASKSPRRKYLLEEGGYNFEIRTMDTEETYPADLPAEEVAEYLARKKAREAKTLLQNGEILLAADSIVILEKEIFGKPTDHADATRILSALSGKMHLVITGVCLLSAEREHSFSAISKVYMEDLSSEEIEYYI